MSCPYPTGECEWPQDCEDCNPDLYAERCEECNGQVEREAWEHDACECEEVEAEPVTVEELKLKMSQDLAYMDSKTRAEIQNAIYWIDVFKTQ